MFLKQQNNWRCMKNGSNTASTLNILWPTREKEQTVERKREKEQASTHKNLYFVFHFGLFLFVFFRIFVLCLVIFTSKIIHSFVSSSSVCSISSHFLRQIYFFFFVSFFFFFCFFKKKCKKKNILFLMRPMSVWNFLQLGMSEETINLKVRFNSHYRILCVSTFKIFCLYERV